MAKRRSGPSEETMFLRGDVGVDGRATEEEQDEVEVEQGKAREQFLRGKAYLGREFLTWLLWHSESGDPLLEFEGEPVTLVLADKLVLRGIAGEVVEAQVRGAMSPYSPIVRQSLERGMLVHQARLRIAHGERQYQVTLDAEHMDCRSAKLPELLSESDDDAILDRLSLAEQLSLIVTALVEAFVKLRAGRKWHAEVVPEMKAWMAEPVAPPQKARARG